MGEHDIRAMMAQVSALLDAQHASTREIVRVAGSLQQLPQLYENQNKILQQGFSNQATFSAELEIARVKADGQALEIIHEEIRDSMKRGQLDLAEEVERLGGRYDKIQSGLNKDASDRVNRLDGPALALMNDDLESGIASWYRDVHTTDTTQLLESFTTTSHSRKMSLGVLGEVLGRVIDKFVGSRQTFHTQSSTLLNQGTVTEADSRYLTIFLVEVVGDQGVNEAGVASLNGRTIYCYVAPSIDAIQGQSQDVSPLLVSLRGSEEFLACLSAMALTGNPAEHFLDSVRPMSPEDKSAVLQAAEAALGNTAPDQVSPSERQRSFWQAVQRGDIQVMGLAEQ